MNKAFTKEEAPDEPFVVPSRAPLPEGVPNYVTERGLACLRAELHGLEDERSRLPASTSAADPDEARAIALVNAKLADLANRLATATLVDPAGQPHDEIRFGATAFVNGEDGKMRHYTIVGVDEADVAHNRVAFVAPLARALLGKRVGDVVILRTPRGEEELEVVRIEYSSEMGRA